MSVPFDIINLKDTTYSQKLNIFPSKIEFIETLTLNSTVNVIKKKITEQVKILERILQNELSDLKGQINEEIENRNRMLDRLKAFEI